MRKCEMINHPDYKRSRGRPKKSWNEVISYDLKTIGLMEDMTQDRRLGRSRIKVVDFR